MRTTTEPILNHDFAGANLSDVSNFVETNETQLKKLNFTTYNWVVIDQNGLDSSTCILVHRKYDPKKKKKSHESEAVRLPFGEAWLMFANMDIANMGFEDWVDDAAGLQDDGTYKWVGPFLPLNEALEREVNARREASLTIAKDLGYID
jgi:hypothetical protein